MLDAADIEADLARGDAEDLRDAFDALVAWSGAERVAGVEDAAALMDLFKRVCGAVAGWDGPTPPGTVRALARRMRIDAGPEIATYAGAAGFALRHSRTWWPAFAASFPDEGPGAG